MYNIKREVSQGALFGIGFIVLNLLFGLAIGFPLLSYSSNLEKYGTVSIMAPLVEEIFFRVALIWMFAFLPLIVNLAINTVAFSAFHYYAYGASLASQNASFIGAGIFAIMALYMTIDKIKHSDLRNNLTLPIASITAHVIINSYLAIKLLGLVVVGI